MNCSHFCKQHQVECVNILPETVDNSMWLGFSFEVEVSCTNQLLIFVNTTQKLININIKKASKLPCDICNGMLDSPLVYYG